MGSNYDLDPLTTPPWWPGVACLLVVAGAILLYVFCEY